MKLVEIDAVKYALGRVRSTLYPRQYPLEDIINRAELSENEFTEKTFIKLRTVKKEIEIEMIQKKDQEYAYLYYLSSDIEKVIKYLSTHSVDFGDIQGRLKEYADETVVPKIREKLGVSYMTPSVNFVSSMPGQQNPGRRGGGFGADKWQSNRYGMPEGIYVHEASLVQDSEILLIHELTHPAVEAFPNFVPWFDEGLCNLMAFSIYGESKGDLSFRRMMKYREEFADYFVDPARLFRRPNYLFCSLILIGGMELVKILMHYKRESPEKVNWNLIPALLQEGVDLKTFSEKAFNEPVELAEPELTLLERRIIATVLAHTVSHVLSPLALYMFEKILQKKPYPGTWRLEELLEEYFTLDELEKAISELKKRSIIWVFPNGDIEPYMGPFIGTNHFFDSGQMRAWAKRYELREWGDTRHQ